MAIVAPAQPWHYLLRYHLVDMAVAVAVAMTMAHWATLKGY